jgi:hypothetical protein
VIGSSADEGVVGMREARFAVGEPNCRRSTVWKFSVHKNEAYILTRMFGSDAKVSLHVNGQCQWSATETWVKKVGGRRNVCRWPTSDGSSGCIAFFLLTVWTFRRFAKQLFRRQGLAVLSHDPSIERVRSR